MSWALPWRAKNHPSLSSRCLIWALLVSTVQILARQKLRSQVRAAQGWCKWERLSRNRQPVAEVYTTESPLTVGVTAGDLPPAFFLRTRAALRRMQFQRLRTRLGGCL